MTGAPGGGVVGVEGDGEQPVNGDPKPLLSPAIIVKRGHPISTFLR